ncbi:hypothetical protein ACIO02_27065 [Streptomyces sp. NPDC087568]|uniref:hypothetical protein n=1 Tax=unclassified Streptomyces TaxID=2593676 RepID=UPI0037F48528
MPRPVHVTALRRRLQALSAQLLWHPYWAGPGRAPAARVELRRQARAAVPRYLFNLAASGPARGLRPLRDPDAPDTGDDDTEG